MESGPEINDKLKDAENELEEVKEIAKVSIDRMVDRGLVLDILVDKTSKLKNDVIHYKKRKKN